jgi:leucyl/phenylalanyl-tRNA--protein transferase
VALAALVDVLRDEHAEDRLLDVQWRTPHLATLGVVEVSREEYCNRLERAVVLPPPAWDRVAKSADGRGDA